MLVLQVDRPGKSCLTAQVFPALFGTLTLLNPMQAFGDQLPPGWDLAGDVLLGTQSPRVSLMAITGAVSEPSLFLSHTHVVARLIRDPVGPVWAITTFYLLPLARNGMSDRPDLAEKVIRAHLISGAIVDVSTPVPRLCPVLTQQPFQ